MQVTATRAENRFGAAGAHALTEPVSVEKNESIDTAIVVTQQVVDLQAANRPGTVNEPKARFEETHSVWIAEQVQRFDVHGLWCDELRVW